MEACEIQVLLSDLGFFWKWCGFFISNKLFLQFDTNLILIICLCSLGTERTGERTRGGRHFGWQERTSEDGLRGPDSWWTEFWTFECDTECLLYMWTAWWRAQVDEIWGNLLSNF